jgi:hypothetical protein
MWGIIRQWETCHGVPAPLGMDGDTSFRTVTGISHQDPIPLFSFMKFIQTNFNELQDYVKFKIVLIGLDWKRVPLTPPLHDPPPHVQWNKFIPFLCQMFLSIFSWCQFLLGFLRSPFGIVDIPGFREIETDPNMSELQTHSRLFLVSLSTTSCDRILASVLL